MERPSGSLAHDRSLSTQVLPRSAVAYLFAHDGSSGHADTPSPPYSMLASQAPPQSTTPGLRLPISVALAVGLVWAVLRQRPKGAPVTTYRPRPHRSVRLPTGWFLWLRLILGTSFACAWSPIANRSSPPLVDLDAFYSADVEKISAFLGPEMHFHHGLASLEVNELLGRSTGSPVAPDEQAAARSLADAVRVLYPHIPLGASVLDVGCGWCGPATLLAEERAASVRGVTIARAQAEFCRTRRAVNTLHADVEEADVHQMLRIAAGGGDLREGGPMHGPNLSPKALTVAKT